MSTTQDVHILNTSFVHLPPREEIIQLSFLDARWIHLQQPVQEILLYPNSILTSSSLSSFKSSLAQALSFFYPIAGRLTYLHSTDQVVIDCSTPDNGVLVIEAESNLNICQLASEDTYNIETFMKLVPHIHMEKLPVPVFAVQITRFVSGGVGVGTALNHCAMDGIGFWRFMETWAEMCLKGGTRCALDLKTNHDRAVILHPEKEKIARKFLRQLALDLPKLYQVPKASVQDRLRLSRRTFILNSAAIQALKQQAILQDSNATISTPSTFVAIAAHFWACLVKSKGCSNKNEDTSLWLLVDLRSHFNTRENTALFTGNCIQGIQANLTCRDLVSSNGIKSACLAITEAVRTVREEPMKGVERWPEEFKNRPAGMSVMVAGSARYGAYEIDFGWGRPGRVELVSMNYDGEVSMLAGREKGSVHATVGLANEHMEMFSKIFLAGLGNVKHRDGPRTAKL